MYAIETTMNYQLQTSTQVQTPTQVQTVPTVSIQPVQQVEPMEEDEHVQIKAKPSKRKLTTETEGSKDGTPVKSAKLTDFLSKLVERGCTIHTPEAQLTSQTCKIEYTCYPCNSRFIRTISDMVKHSKANFGCRDCNNFRLKSQPTEKDEVYLHQGISSLQPVIEGEEWRSLVGGWISSHGRAINALGKVLTPDDRHRFYFAGKLQYANILIRDAFRLKPCTNEVSLHSVQTFKNTVTIVHKTVVEPIPKPDKFAVPDGTDDFFSKYLIPDLSHCSKVLAGIKYKFLDPLLPKFVVFEDGTVFKPHLHLNAHHVWNGLPNVSGYLHMSTPHGRFYVHRLVCWAFKPIDGLTSFSDYEHLQVNHINGNKIDNRAENLEWVDKNQNMQHAYDTNLNQKKRSVRQHRINPDGTVGELISTFDSIAKASKETGEPEHRIRETAKGSKKVPTNYWWKFVDESVSEAWSKKFSSKPKH